MAINNFYQILLDAYFLSTFVVADPKLSILTQIEISH